MHCQGEALKHTQDGRRLRWREKVYLKFKIQFCTSVNSAPNSQQIRDSPDENWLSEFLTRNISKGIKKMANLSVGNTLLLIRTRKHTLSKYSWLRQVIWPIVPKICKSLRFDTFFLDTIGHVTNCNCSEFGDCSFIRNYLTYM